MVASGVMPVSFCGHVDRSVYKYANEKNKIAKAVVHSGSSLMIYKSAPPSNFARGYSLLSFYEERRKRFEIFVVFS